MEKDWRKVFQKELCEHGIELDLDGKKFKGLITTFRQSKCSEVEMKSERGDTIAYIDADLEVPPIDSIITSSNGEKLTVVSHKLEGRIGIPPIFTVLFLKRS
jgi:hypothetical protein